MKLLAEPLLHFVLAGGLLFAAYAWLSPETDPGASGQSRTVHVTAAEIEWLKQTWGRQWQRPPSGEELKGLVADYLRETLLAREARALGLDENDTVVRRRLAQKLEFMLQDTARLGEPGEGELRRCYEANRDRFRSPARVSFSHVYFSRDRRGAQAETDAREALDKLSRADTGASAPELGDPFLGRYEFVDAEEPDVAAVLGPEPARRVLELEPGPWHGPIESPYGLHLVRVAARQAAQARDLASVEAEVRALWREQRERQWREDYFAALIDRYDLVVDDSVKPLLGPLAAAKAFAR